MAKLASLVVDLQLQSAQLRKGLDEANAKLDAFAKKVDKAAGVITAAFAFDWAKDAAVQLAGFVKSGADAADAMGNLAQSVGVPVEELSRLAYAASFGGLSAEQLGGALQKLTKVMAEAQSGSGEQAAVFEALGISVSDASGKLRSSGDVFTEVAERFSKLEDGAAKTALAQEVFGQSGAALIPLLNQGAEGLRAFGDEAERTGNLVTKEGAEAAGRFNNALSKLEHASTGLATRVAQELAPSMAALAEELVGSKNGAHAFDDAAKVLATTMRLLASGGTLVWAVFDSVGKSLAGLAAAVANAVQGKWREALLNWQDSGQAVLDGWGTTADRLGAIWEEKGPGKALEKDAEKSKPAADEVVRNLNRIRQAEKEREEASKRASAERERAEKAALKAAEAAGKALDDYAASQLSLERQLQGIDRDVANRRAAAHPGNPTAGFDSFDSALRVLADAMKAEASERDRARQLERDGDVLGAHNAELAAEAHREVAEWAGRAADAFEEAARKLRETSWGTTVGDAVTGAGKGLASAAMGASPILGDALTGAAQGAAAGPAGIIVGAASALLAHSEGFAKAMDSVNGILQMAADKLGAMFDSLGPLLQVVGTLVENVLQPLTPVFDLLGVVMQGVALVVGTVVNGIALVWNGILEAVALVVGIFDGNAADGLRRQKMKYVDLDSLLAPPAEKAADAVDELGKAAQAASGALNVPSWWMQDTARFQAAVPGAGYSGGGGTVIHDNSSHSYTIVQQPDEDAEALAERVERIRTDRVRRKYGSTYADDGRVDSGGY